MNHWPPPPVTEADLQAYVDGVLAPARRAEIDAYLAQRPAEAGRLDAYAAQNRQLSALYGPQLEIAVPARWRMPPAPARQPWWRLAAAALLVLAGGAGGWAMRAALPDSLTAALPPPAPAAPMGDGLQLAHMAAVAHAVYAPDQRRPVEIDGTQEQQLVTWLSKRLGTPVHAPALTALGYALIGGRLLPGGSGPVAQFMYQDQAGQRLTLYVSNQAPGRLQRDTAFRFAREGQVNVFYWIDGNFGYALSGAIDKRTLGDVAGAVYRQLAPAP